MTNDNNKIRRDVLHKAAEAFGVNMEFRPIGNGHINDTYVSEDGKYVLQRINTDVFCDPEALMKNIVRVTDHLRRKSILAGEDPDRCVLHFLQTAESCRSEQSSRPSVRQGSCKHLEDGGKMFTDQDGTYFRMMLFVPGTVVIDPENCQTGELRECGRGYGGFLARLQDLDASRLTETIPDFHNTPKRFLDLCDAVKKDCFGRAARAQKELAAAYSHKGRISVITDRLAEGNIPLCITHNDTKINNILFDAETKKARCVIDLDTVMPGSRLYDYGDALRTAAVTAGEDEEELSAVNVNMEAFEAFTAGFLEETGDTLTLEERRLMPFSFFLMTYECGIRFLEDYLRGDVYFRTGRPDHNLIRAKNQLAMAQRILDLQQEMEAVIHRLG